MPVDASQLASRLDSLLERVSRAAEAGGRSLSDVAVVAVTKTVPPPLIREAHRLGLRLFGENRVQEAAAKRVELPGLEGSAWHLIGHLQTNKVTKALGLFDVVQSVDSERLAEALDREAAKAGRTVACLAEVKTSPEEAKHGMDPAALDGFLEKAAAWPRLKFQGLMTVAPWSEDPAAARPSFARLRELAERRRAAFGGRPVLSMGMSSDFEAAVAEGSTMIRIGTALFGDRS
jgi:PLP dependent protein